MVYIKVENISKEYRVHQQSLRESLMYLFSRGKKAKKLSYHALKNVSFTLQEGDVVGVLGGNGAGKSTLLKILSRVTAPTSGRVQIRGRVSSLLEVGTGFHPELTGRENIFFNGAILGMAYVEIKKRFHEIVTFAGVADFLDVPVKRYSSGMLLRLAFSVAAHLDSEILIVDEVLAVGDSAFQKKCMSLMDDLSGQGRTILCVSHNIGMLRALCKKALLLERGSLIAQGDSRTIVDHYLFSGRASRTSVTSSELEDLGKDNVIQFDSLSVTDKEGGQHDTLSIHENILISFAYRICVPGYKLSVGIMLSDERGNLISLSLDTTDEEWQGKIRPCGYYTSTCVIPGNFLNDGQLDISLVVYEDGIQKRLMFENIVTVNISDDMSVQGARADFMHEWPAAAVRPVFFWKNSYTPMQIVQPYASLDTMKK